MSILRYEGSYAAGSSGLSVVTGVGSSSVAIPNASDGTRARFVRLTATGACYVKFGRGATTATNNDILVVGAYPEIYECKAYDTIAYIQQAASQQLNITPLDT